MLLPFATNAAAQARCIELLEAAAWIVPFNCDGRIVAFMNRTLMTRIVLIKTDQ